VNASNALPQEVDWLIDAFAKGTAGVAHAALVSADGLLLATSTNLEGAAGDQLAAIASGLASLTRGAAKVFDGGDVLQTIVEMQAGFLFVMSVSNGSQLAVLATPTCDIGLVGYEMTQFVKKVKGSLTPAAREQSSPVR
jgi:uncharacterized protein